MKKFILPVAILLGCIILGGFIYASQLNKQKFSEKQQQIDPQTKCADTASKYFTSKGDKRGSEYNYENHYNTKLNKCFILVSYFNMDDDSLVIDLYDAVEGKHYAMYLGHSNCDVASLSLLNTPNKCVSDAGNIWYDGDDTKNPNFTVGFRGLLNGGGAGDENTQKQFMEAIQPFMSN